MIQIATGSFQVEMKPRAERRAENGGCSLGRMSLDKEYEGDIAAVGTGEMLTAVTKTEGSAGYVAIERVTGTLHGLEGSFVLQHSGRMNRGAPELTISVVPDSGTGELQGLAGTFSLDVVDGKHVYEFEYTLPG